MYIKMKLKKIIISIFFGFSAITMVLAQTEQEKPIQNEVSVKEQIKEEKEVRKKVKKAKKESKKRSEEEKSLKKEQKLEQQIASKKKKIKKNDKQIKKLNAKLEKGIVKGTLSPVEIERLNLKIKKLQESNLKNTQKINKLTKRK